MLILNDIHIGVQRQGGTTPQSREGLRTYLFSSLRSTLAATTETEMVIVGDLFDEFEVSPRDWIETYLILSNWCASGNGLFLVAGNHDWSPKGLRVSSFEMLCQVLAQEYDEFVRIVDIDRWSIVRDGDLPCNDIALAHCSNQDIFDQKLAEVLKVAGAGTRVLLHANYDNHFAVESDHSLNVSVDQAKAFASKGATLYFAHEHQARTELGGSVVVFGNQWPTSIADCLGNDVKSAHVFSGGVQKIETWDCRDLTYGFSEINWRDLSVSDGGFIRVVGDASSNEAGDVISAIAKFRSKSDAFVISNAVKIDGIVQAEELSATFEATKSFDVMDFIKGAVSAEEWTAIEELNKVTE
jgi:metallophosphoesterase superfamily enzyme